MHRNLKYELVPKSLPSKAGLFFAFCFLGVIFNPQAQGWSRSVNLARELTDASLVAQVKILSYDKGELKYQVIRKPQHPFIASYSYAENSSVMEFLNAKELSSLKSEGPMTSTWPAVGTEVLLVLDAKQRVSLFAARQGTNFRFWSPWESDDVPIFKCESPARGLPSEIHDDSRHFSHEGCLYPAHLLIEKLPKEVLK